MNKVIYTNTAADACTCSYIAYIRTYVRTMSCTYIVPYVCVLLASCGFDLCTYLFISHIRRPEMHVRNI